MENIAKALATAQKEMGKALKQTQNPHFRSKYADLANVMDACMPALNEAGIAVIQPMTETNLGRYVKTVFLHETGESLECFVPLIIGKDDMQGLGSAITYARRYGLMALAGIAPEDDDGNAAANSAPKQMSWAQTLIAEQASPGATDHEKAEIIATALTTEWGRKKTAGELSNHWDRRAREIGALEKFEGLHSSVVDAYETRMMKVTENETSKEAAE